jgi:hypothetical protein
MSVPDHPSGYSVLVNEIVSISSFVHIVLLSASKGVGMYVSILRPRSDTQTYNG